jgi:hypothetical protein
MCTVTFIPAGDKLYLTSNRDEKLLRKRALPPLLYSHEDVRLIYPKDEDAGGTWIALNENGNVAVLLNGGFQSHVSTPPYKKSRGLVFLDIIRSYLPTNFFLNADFSGIEPFTIIIFQQNKLFECRWTGDKKFHKELNTCETHIWSSATLYDDQVREKRKLWFGQWLKEKSNIVQEDIIQFHRFAGDGNKNTDLVMNRGGVYQTVSITSIEITKENTKMCYYDLQTEENYILNTRIRSTPKEDMIKIQN